MEELRIKGLFIEKQFLHIRGQEELVAFIDSSAWSNELKRRVQHFGYYYNYKIRRISSNMEIAPIPEWGRTLIQKIYTSGVATLKFNQLIINEYLPGQGIAPHIDCIPCFDNEIVSISLGSSCLMTFSNKKQEEKFDVMLEPGDLLLIKDEARYQWHHQIKPRKIDTWKGIDIIRERRLSLTFRKVRSLIL
jgi:alkylated DNA repair dioxygenase AlkB